MSVSGDFRYLSYRRGISKTGKPFMAVWLVGDTGIPCQLFLSNKVNLDEAVAFFDSLSSYCLFWCSLSLSPNANGGFNVLIDSVDEYNGKEV